MAKRKPPVKRVSIGYDDLAVAAAHRRLVENDSFTIKEIAEEVGCSRTHLYKCERFQRFLDTLGDRGHIARGRKDRDGGLDAWREEQAEDEDDEW